MADGDGLDELSLDNVREYLAVKVIFGPAVLEAIVGVYERYRMVQFEQGKTWMDLTAFINKAAVHGCEVMAVLLKNIEDELKI